MVEISAGVPGETRLWYISSAASEILPSELPLPRCFMGWGEIDAYFGSLCVGLPTRGTQSNPVVGNSRWDESDLAEKIAYELFKKDFKDRYGDKSFLSASTLPQEADRTPTAAFPPTTPILTSSSMPWRRTFETGDRSLTRTQARASGSPMVWQSRAGSAEESGSR